MIFFLCMAWMEWVDSKDQSVLDTKAESTNNIFDTLRALGWAWVWARVNEQNAVQTTRGRGQSGSQVIIRDSTLLGDGLSRALCLPSFSTPAAGYLCYDTIRQAYFLLFFFWSVFAASAYSDLWLTPLRSVCIINDFYVCYLIRDKEMSFILFLLRLNQHVNLWRLHHIQVRQWILTEQLRLDLMQDQRPWVRLASIASGLTMLDLSD